MNGTLTIRPLVDQLVASGLSEDAAVRMAMLTAMVWSNHSGSDCGDVCPVLVEALRREGFQARTQVVALAVNDFDRGAITVMGRAARQFVAEASGTEVVGDPEYWDDRYEAHFGDGGHMVVVVEVAGGEVLLDPTFDQAVPDRPVQVHFCESLVDDAHWVIEGGDSYQAVYIPVQLARRVAVHPKVKAFYKESAKHLLRAARIGRGMHQFGGAVLVVERVAQEDAE